MDNPMISRVIFCLSLFALISPLACAWSDYQVRYFADAAVKNVWGQNVYNECLGKLDKSLQDRVCQLFGEDKKPVCYALELTHPAEIPNKLGDEDLEQVGDCPIIKNPEKSYLCTTKNNALDAAGYWLNQSEHAGTRCERIYLFAVASNYLAQAENPFNTVLYEDKNCREMIYRKIERSLEVNRSRWGFDQACAFNYLQGDKQFIPNATYIQIININDRHASEIIENLSAEAKEYYTKPLATTVTVQTTTTTTLPSEPLYCQKDEDCTTAVKDCCGCNAGGQNIPISKDAKTQYEAQSQAYCRERVCPQFSSQHISCFSAPLCENNRCELIIDSDMLCQRDDIKNNCEGEPKTDETGQSSEYGVSCGYINYVCDWEGDTQTSTTQTTLQQTTTSLKTVNPTTTTIKTPTTTITPEKNEGGFEASYLVVVVFFAAAAVFLVLRKRTDSRGDPSGKRSLQTLSDGRRNVVSDKSATRLSTPGFARIRKPDADEVKKTLDEKPVDEPKKDVSETEKKGKYKTLIRQEGDDTSLGKT